MSEGRGRGASDAELYPTRSYTAAHGDGDSLYQSVASLGMREVTLTL